MYLTGVVIHTEDLHDFTERLYDFSSNVLECFIVSALVSRHCEFLSSVPDFTLSV